MIDKVTWPEHHHPRISPLYGLNDIDIAAPPEVVWRLLVEAENWVRWFPPEDTIEIIGGAFELGMGSTYTRVTVGHPMRCTVQEFEPARRLSWSTTVDGDETGSTAYHGWIITPTATGCHVLTEETQQGEFFLDLIGHRMPGAIWSYHQDMVEALARAAQERVAATGSAT